MGDSIYTEKDVVERFGRGLPAYRKVRRSKDYRRTFDKTDRAEMDAVIGWLVSDDEFRRLVDVYASYCRIAADRGYGSSADRDLVLRDHPGMVERLARNFAKCEVEYIWHDMVCGANEIMTGDGGDGYWPFLDAEYLDIAHMKVGGAIINLDEVWSVVSDTMDEFIRKCAGREAGHHPGSNYVCDRCGAAIYDRQASRFDAYENLLHCQKCAKECTHWKGHRK